MDLSFSHYHFGVTYNFVIQKVAFLNGVNNFTFLSRILHFYVRDGVVEFRIKFSGGHIHLFEALLLERGIEFLINKIHSFAERILRFA